MNRKSWKTTAAGLASAIGVLLSVILPALNVQIVESKIDELAGAITFLVGLIWMGMAARDDDVTSEGRTATKNARHMRSNLWLLMLMAPAIILLPACSQQRVGGVREVGPTGYRSEGPVSNALVIDKDGQTSQEYLVEPPAAVIANAGGVENYGSVPFGQASIQLPNGVSLVTSVPNDFDATGVEVTLAPDGTSTVHFATVGISTSAVLVARATFAATLAPIIKDMTAEQRAALVAELEAQAALGDSIAAGVLPIIRVLVGG